MPIIKSAKKRVLQAKKAYERNKQYGSKMRTMVKKVLKETDATKAEKLLPETFSAIDVALKKNLLHKNNAAHKKARVAKVVAGLKDGTGVKEVEEKKVKKVIKKVAPKSATKKTVAKKTASKKVAKTTTAKKVEEKK